MDISTPSSIAENRWAYRIPHGIATAIERSVPVVTVDARFTEGIRWNRHKNTPDPRVTATGSGCQLLLVRSRMDVHTDGHGRGLFAYCARRVATR
jgi:hypothetical protein